MSPTRAWLFAARLTETAWQGLASTAYRTHVGCQGFALLTFDGRGICVSHERVLADNPDGAVFAAERDHGIKTDTWRPCYAVLDNEPLTQDAVEALMVPARVEEERDACLRDQYGDLFNDAAKLVGPTRAAHTLPRIRSYSSAEALRSIAGPDADALWDAWWRYPDIDPSEKVLLADIAEHGWHSIGVTGDAESPGFTYSVGFVRTLRRPEVIVVGLPTDLAHATLWEAFRRFQSGEELRPGHLYHDFLEGHAVTFIAVDDEPRREHLGFAEWYYDADFEALQLVWPGAVDGSWPWQNAEVAELQPLLGRVPSGLQ